MQHCLLLRFVAPDVVTVASRVGMTASATLSSRLKNVENNNNNNNVNTISKTHESESESVHLYPFSSNNIATSNSNNSGSCSSSSSNNSRVNTNQGAWHNNSNVLNNDSNNITQKLTLTMKNTESTSFLRGKDSIANENNNNSNRNTALKAIKNSDSLFSNNINNNIGIISSNTTSNSSSTKSTGLTNISLGATKAPAKSNTGFPDIPHPYATEGGQVPIYQMQYGIIYKRNWIYRNPEWCELCREPCIQWVQHIGRKDHCLMDMYYTAHVEWKRRWNPEELLKHFYKELKLPLPSYQNVYTNYEREHHNELYAMLVELSEAGMLNFDSPSETFLHRMQGGLRGMSAQGALVLHELILLPFMRLFPHAHIQDLSNLLDFVTCSYNLETVYDLCGLYTLDKVARREQYAATSPAALGLGGIATSSSATTGFARDATAGLAQQQQQQQQQQRNGGYNSINENNLMNKNSGVGVSDPQVEMNRPISKAEIMRNRLKAKQQEDLDSEVLSHKGTFVRSILGQLRWLILPNQIHPAKFTFPEHVIMLGEICLKTFVAEIAATRLCEYVTRCEVPWRNAGFERKRLNMREIIKDKSDVTPPYVRFSYKSMSPKFDDVYTIEPSLLDKEVRDKLKRKGLPVLPEYEDQEEKINSGNGGGGTNNISVDNKAKKLRQTELPKGAGQPRLYSVNIEKP